MKEVRVTMTEFKKSLGEWVNRAAYGQMWVILVARGRPRAAIVSLEDLKALQQLRQKGGRDGARQLEALDAFREHLRQRWKATGRAPLDSAALLREAREERVNANAHLR